ncbi:MAG: hypothetical protein Q9170_005758 [Blastenia crenularia]
MGYSTPSPPDVSCTFGPHLYQIQDIAGKGRGLVAGVKIFKGQRVLRERPLFTCSLLWTSYKDFEDCLKEIVASLPSDKQGIFFSLHNANPEKEHSLAARFLTNCFPTHDRSEGAVYGINCLINHSCRANFYGSWNPEAGVAVVQAIRDIEAGEEILFNYVSGLTYDKRTEKLGRLFGISCSCELCSLPTLDIKKSDARREEIQKLFDGYEDMRRAMEKPELCLVDCSQQLKLIEEEYLGASEYYSLKAQAYGIVARICAMHSDLASACALQKRSYDLRVISEGHDSPLVRQMKSAIDSKAQDHPTDALRARSRWYTKRGQEPKLLKFMGVP